MPSNMHIQDAIRMTKQWFVLGGNPEIELGAMEPLLWTDRGVHLPELCRHIKSVGQTDNRPLLLSITTNGQRLYAACDELSPAHVDKVRVSWHTSDPLQYERMTGGDLGLLQRGIQKAIGTGFNVSINRLLLRGHVEDLPRQIEFVAQYNLTLKLYDLYWMPHYADLYDDFFIPCEEVIDRYLSRMISSSRVVPHDHSRTRVQYDLQGGGRIVIKKPNRNIRNGLCRSCRYQDRCQEGFLEYLRVDTSLKTFPCYMRNDICFNAGKWCDHETENSRKRDFLEGLNLAPDEDLSGVKLILMITRNCNSRCLFPGSDISWCLKKRVGKFGVM